MNARIVKSFAAAVGALVALVASAHAAVTFQPKQDSASTSPFALASADFNGDGRARRGDLERRQRQLLGPARQWGRDVAGAAQHAGT